jgi:hypothetical protein
LSLFKPCSACGEKKPGKFASLYWAHFNGNGDRKAWRQVLCRECLVENFGSLLGSTNADSMGPSICPACGGTSTDDLDPVFLKLYLPKMPEKEFELATCAACAANLLPLTQVGAAELVNRSAAPGAPSPTQSSEWTDLPF